MSTKLVQPSIALFLAEFIRKFEDKLCANNDVHLINFHARMYHLILQKLDSNNYHKTHNLKIKQSLNQSTTNSVPRSLHMSIIDFVAISQYVEADIITEFDYNQKCHSIIHRFFQLLIKQINKAIIKKKNKNRNKLSKKNAKSVNYDINIEKNKSNHFGPYSRKNSLRDDEPRQLESSNELKFKLIYNDSTKENWAKLVDLKEIFHECLPQMPTPYISRIIFDKKHRSMIVLLKDNVFGGVCFRPFAELNFAEVVFLAISPNHQIKGFGTRLMNHLKEMLKKMGIYHIVTYADNNAIDYFAKQGFGLIATANKVKNCEKNENENKIDAFYGCKNLDFSTILQSKYIKIYNGAQLMHSRIIKNVNYCKLNEHLMRNRLVLVKKLSKISHSMKRQKGLKNVPIEIMNIPGMKGCGLSKSVINETKSNLFETEHTTQSVEIAAKISGILKQLNGHSKVAVFAKPVDPIQAGNYYEVIKKPMDLSKIQRKVNRYEYKSMTQFVNDFNLIITNCKLFNPSSNPYHQFAIEFDEYFKKIVNQY